MEPKEISGDTKNKAIEIESLKNLLQRNFSEIENISLGNISAGIPTSFYDFDAMTQGLRRGDLIAFAGRPSMGKTSLGTNIAFNAAEKFKELENESGEKILIEGGKVVFLSKYNNNEERDSVFLIKCNSELVSIANLNKGYIIPRRNFNN